MTCLMQILCLQYKKGGLSSTSQLHGFLSLTMSVTTILHLSGFRRFLNYATQSTLSWTAAPVEEVIQSQHINKQSNDVYSTKFSHFKYTLNQEPKHLPANKFLGKLKPCKRVSAVGLA